MRELLAFVRRDALVAASYRANMLFSLLSLFAMVIPLYFIAGAVQPIIGPSIAREGGEYFAFVVLGMATFQVVNAAVVAIPGAVASGIRNGTFEALLATPTRLATLVAGMFGYQFLWSIARALVIVLAGALLGADLELARLGLAVLLWGGIALAYVPFALLASAMLILTRTTGPLPNIVVAGSMLLGGVYYPTHVIPSWIQRLSDLVPLTYGLRAVRRVLAPAAATAPVGADVAALGALAVVFLAAAALLLQLALRHARRAGSLAQY